MIDFGNLQSYRENNRIEAKKALGGFPQSVWETYSAFANTFGGIILLGVEERPDKSLHAVNLANAEDLAAEFRNSCDDRQKVSVNILSGRDVRVEEVDGNHIVVITVPRAQRADKPVYIGSNPFTGSYRRNGEGDYKCDKEEVLSMLRDAALHSRDCNVVEKAELRALNFADIGRYRSRMASSFPSHAWDNLGDGEFLYKTGAAARGEDGELHPTAAGLLAFGNEYEIIREFPDYFLDYRETDEKGECTFRISSVSGDWSGNVYSFFERVYERLIMNINLRLQCEEKDVISARAALKEALINCLVNADYCGRSGVVITAGEKGYAFSNPGNFRLDIDAAKSGGISDPRNTGLVKIFNLIGIGERAGSGIPNIFSAWRKLGLPTPWIGERIAPERTCLTLPLKKSAIKSGFKRAAIKKDDKDDFESAIRKEQIIRYLTDRVSAGRAEICKLLGVSASRANILLAEMADSGIIVSEGNDKNKSYRLKR